MTTMYKCDICGFSSDDLDKVGQCERTHLTMLEVAHRYMFPTETILQLPDKINEYQTHKRTPTALYIAAEEVDDYGCAILLPDGRIKKSIMRYELARDQKDAGKLTELINYQPPVTEDPDESENPEN